MMKFRVGAEQQLHADKVLQIYGRARKTREEVLSWVVYSLERRGRQVIRLESAKGLEDIERYCDEDTILVLTTRVKKLTPVIEAIRDKVAGVICVSIDKNDAICTDDDVVIHAQTGNNYRSAAVVEQPKWDRLFLC